MNLSTDLAKVCARESAIDATINELFDRTADIGGVCPGIMLHVSCLSRGRHVTFTAVQGSESFSAETLEKAIRGMKDIPAKAEKLRAEAAKLLEEAKALDGVEK